ncbi:uncharacterized protein [Physcomitrium patens]|uniref:DDT domain-containing protein n=1 Tax=Physcomitrium patens TaxID=3218 RepID=A0A2K1L7B3_PHYPA|nr:DDT domain-containing protein DDR4-like [Physcomitrium patens]XP_024388256.1 DDT domain-containing protein DDR4-like [Physcomitrium patens]PNR61940.1 hypothetical protein PHYPA_000364 [Physcomitrium patens]|eukprot:XP_024388249.1 DDT domain-containing protein DDR4-like [Physcomitrella patens]
MMNEARNRKERTERKRPLGDINRRAMARPASPPVAETPVKRPSRACSSRLRVSNASDGGVSGASPTPPLPRSSSKASNERSLSGELPPSWPSASRTGARAMSLALGSTMSPERMELRGLWEMAAVMNFFCIFRPIINNLPEFTMEELESAMLFPNPMLDTIHVVMLKGVPPAARVPLRGDTWPTVLSKKFKDWWWRVAEGPCPLVPCQGAELATYRELDPPTRVRVLLALCEMRVDQDDTRLYIDDSVKRNQMGEVRKERAGCGAEGTTFWLDEDQMMGQRLYREGQATMPQPPSKNKARGWGRGRNVPPPIPGNWETCATNFEEFQEVSNRLLESRNRLEVAMGKKLMQSLMPQLEEIQKKKDRLVKKQQREAVLLDNMLAGNGLAAGRSRRERKPVTYTFDEFDRSINEAIRFTKKGASDTSLRRDGLRFGNGANEAGHLGKERNGQGGYANGVSGVRRSSRNSQAHLGAGGEGGVAGSEPHLVEADLGFSDDEIEGEAVYHDDYLAARQRKERSYSSERGESSRGELDDADFDEVEEKAEEENEDYGGGNDGDGDGDGSEERAWKRPRRGPKVRLVNDVSREGVHRNARPVFDRGGGRGGGSEEEEEEGSDPDEQIVRDAQQRLRMGEGAGTGNGGRGGGGVVAGRGDAGFEEASEVSGGDEGSGYSSGMRNGKGGGAFEEERKGSRASLMDEDAKSVGHSGEQSVGYSGRSGSGEDQQEAGSVDFDEEEGTGEEAERSKGGGRRKQLLDLNEVATAARGSSLVSDNGESESESSDDGGKDGRGDEGG